MTPENDVNKEIDPDAADNAKSDTAADAPKSLEDVVEGVLADAAEEASIQADGENQQTDDVDRAANAQSEAQSDDPLGFGDTRMDGADTDGDDEMGVLRAQLTESEARVASQQDQLLRIQAEMENQRKRAQNDVTKAHKFALEKFALDLLPVKDSLEMGLLAATAEDAEPTKIIEGSELTLKMLAQALEKYNIVEVNPVDEKFDPEFHQAMSMQPVEGKQPNTVASVMQKGYTLNERLIRPALVMVAK